VSWRTFDLINNLWIWPSTIEGAGNKLQAPSAYVQQREEKTMSCNTKGNFIDFIIALKDREDLYTGFLACQSDTELENFFRDNHYDVPPADCAKLHEAMKDMGIEEGRIPPAY
jgi:hypothetical protein